jgi:hypothetical protein
VLRHVLEKMDGHFIAGYGAAENRPDTPIHLVPGAEHDARSFLDAFPDTLARFDRVARLIEGFETPLGMELLATVHWVATHDEPRSRDAQSASEAIHAWSPRKARLMSAEHVQAAWNRLQEERWLR